MTVVLAAHEWGSSWAAQVAASGRPRLRTARDAIVTGGSCGVVRVCHAWPGQAIWSSGRAGRTAAP
jgi:hypothetical protein